MCRLLRGWPGEIDSTGHAINQEKGGEESSAPRRKSREHHLGLEVGTSLSLLRTISSSLGRSTSQASRREPVTIRVSRSQLIVIGQSTTRWSWSSLTPQFGPVTAFVPNTVLTLINYDSSHRIDRGLLIRCRRQWLYTLDLTSLQI